MKDRIVQVARLLAWERAGQGENSHFLIMPQQRLSDGEEMKKPSVVVDPA
jgi:hypothetical protein